MPSDPRPPADRTRRRSGWGRRTFAAVALWMALAPAGRAIERFPRPEFESGYTLPAPTTPPPRASWMDFVDVAVLAAALAVSAYAVLRRRSRRWIVGLVVFSILYFGFWRQGCVCPVGSIQNVAAAWFDPAARLPIAVLGLFLLPLVFALLFGRVFCGAVCPLGALQDLAAVRAVRLPRPLAVALESGPLVVLALTVVWAANGGGFFTCRWDPFVGFFRLAGPLPMLLLGAGVLLLGVWVARPYCRFFCPYGVLLGWLSALSWRHLTITPDDCIQCRLCEDVCPFDAILPSNTDQPLPPRRPGVRRLAMLVAFLPAAALIGAWIGHRSSAWVARRHATVALAERVAQETLRPDLPPSVETETFRASATPVKDLEAAARAARRRFDISMRIAGAFLGLAIAGRLLSASVHRVRKDFVPNRRACLGCARCFQACPRERIRHKGRGDESRGLRPTG